MTEKIDFMFAAFSMRRCWARPSARRSTRRSRAGRPRGADLAEPRCALDLERFRRARRCARRRLARARPATRRTDRRLVAQSAGMDADAIRRRQGGAVFVTINPAYRLNELEFALHKVGCAALVTATAFKTIDFIEMVNTLAPELAARTRPPARGKIAATALRHPDRRDECAGTIAFDEVTRIGGARHRERSTRSAKACSSTTRSTSSSPAAPRASPKGVTLSHHNILNNGYFIGRTMQLTSRIASAFPCRSITASAW